MANTATEINIFTKDTNIFTDASVRYFVPLYQRAYAWADKEISQLIEDIDGNDSDCYYIGSLVVYKRDNGYEVIDGQQRLTTLLLLFISLGIHVENTSLAFDCRKKSNETLKHLIEGSTANMNDEDVESSLMSGISIIKHKFTSEKIDRELFKEKLSKVVLYRIEVPEGTDLNRYFEIMNTRGEQLEQHDILKAKFIEHIARPDDKLLFANIWEACSDMTGYVQMHFTTKTAQNKNLREGLFLGLWNDLQTVVFEQETNECAYDCENLSSDVIPNIEESVGDVKEDLLHQLEKILAHNSADYKVTSEIVGKGDKVRFESPISFPFFLLHVLRVYHKVFKTNIVCPSLLDDSKIIDEYNKLFQTQDCKELPEKFINVMLRCRCLLDRFIIKREYVNEDNDGVWSLKQLNKSDADTAYYTQTFDNKNILMLQSAMRVSFTSPRVMHWITDLLIWLYEQTKVDENEYEKRAEECIKKNVSENYLTKEGYTVMGVSTPHIVFNYLDYLLWKENQEQYRDFVFEYRNSVEHWYPQNPSGGTFERWEQKDLDHFGNLCIIQRNVNSKFSNLEPHSKKSTFEAMINKGSLKLRLMAGKTTDGVAWKDVFEEFGINMLKILKTACMPAENNNELLDEKL